MTKMPFIRMKIFGNQFLPWWLLGHILNKKKKTHLEEVFEMLSVKYPETFSLVLPFFRLDLVKVFLKLTSGGRHSSACLLRTENPP